MKQLIIVFFGIFTISITRGFSQGSPSPKGYYSISGKSGKLPAIKSPVNLEADTASFPGVKKGYYSIGDNNKKLPPVTRIQLIGRKPSAPKGYYSHDSTK
jgi:hypothetical protein